MPVWITVHQGDSISSIAFEHGHFPGTVWADSANAELRNLRKDPNILAPGDVVVVPDRTPANVPVGTGKRHVVRRLGVPSTLRMRFLDGDEPAVGLEYTLEIDGETLCGTTDGDGVLEHRVRPSAGAGVVEIGGRRISVRVGHLDPIELESGLRARLSNLQLLSSDANGQALREALLAFQRTQHLPETGAADGPTCDKLVELHGS
jgi:hypothetical protein